MKNIRDKQNMVIYSFWNSFNGFLVHQNKYRYLKNKFIANATLSKQSGRKQKKKLYVIYAVDLPPFPPRPFAYIYCMRPVSVNLNCRISDSIFLFTSNSKHISTSVWERAWKKDEKLDEIREPTWTTPTNMIRFGGHIAAVTSHPKFQEPF